MCAWMIAQGYRANGQQLKTYDSLQQVLAYFYHYTGNTDFKQNLERSGTLLSTHTATDSLALQLINTQRVLINLLIDSALLNRYPFNNTLLISLGNHVADICKLLPHKENLYYASAVNNLGILYIKKYPRQPSDDINASGLFKTAFEIRKKLLNENNPDYAESLFWNSLVYWGAGETAKAYTGMLRALTIMKRTTGEENLTYCNCISHFAQLCKEMKKYDTSILLHEQEIKIREKLWGSKNSNYALYLYYTGEMMGYLWQYQKAFTYYQQALNI